jgi:hypothetical protein
MDCEKLREVLIEHVDGLLGREEAEFARAHLAECAPCRALQEEVRRNFAALDAWEDEDLPSGAFERLRARIPSGPSAVGAAPAPVHRRWVRLLLPYAAGLATAAAGMLAAVRLGADASADAPRPESPVPAISGLSSGGAAPTGGFAPASALADSEGRPPAARDAETAQSPQPGERALIFRDADRGVLRKFFLPAGLEPDRVMLIDAERVPSDPAGVR